MEKPIIKCKLFENTEEFEKFQIDNNVQCYQIQPIIIGMDVKSKKKSVDMKAKVNMHIFITYIEVKE